MNKKIILNIKNKFYKMIKNQIKSIKKIKKKFNKTKLKKLKIKRLKKERKILEDLIIIFKCKKIIF